MNVIQTIQLSKAQFDRTVYDFTRYAEEKGQVEFFGSAFYFFGSELATLRLLRKYRNCETATQDFSRNLGEFRLNPNAPESRASFTIAENSLHYAKITA